MLHGKTQIILDLAEKKSRKKLSCTPSTSEVFIGYERSNIWILESIIEDIYNIEFASEYSIVETPLVTSSSLIVSKEYESGSSTSRDT